ncbi:MAG: stage II sporulation protein M [Woeseiaceae bacterium]
MSNRHDAIEKWLQEQLPRWRDAAGQLSRIEKSKSAHSEEVMSTVHAYGEIARDLSVARHTDPGGKLARYLEQVYARFYRALYRKPGSFWQDIKDLFFLEVPEIARSLSQQIFSVSTLFILSGLAGWWLVSTYPELASLFASEDMINGVSRGELWTDDLLNVLPSSMLALSILSNNVAVTLFAMCLGVFYGLGTIYIISMNGLMLGGIFAMTAQHNLATRLFEFVIAHGIVELSVICIAGAIGVSLGTSIARPGNQTRAQSFHKASIRSAKLIFVCALFLVGAGLIEGYISPNRSYSLAFKVSVGVLYMTIFVATLSGAPRRLLTASRLD